MDRTIANRSLDAAEDTRLDFVEGLRSCAPKA